MAVYGSAVATITRVCRFLSGTLASCVTRAVTISTSKNKRPSNNGNQIDEEYPAGGQPGPVDQVEHTQPCKHIQTTVRCHDASLTSPNWYQQCADASKTCDHRGITRRAPVACFSSTTFTSPDYQQTFTSTTTAPRK